MSAGQALASRIELGDARGAEASAHALSALRPESPAVTSSVAGGVAIFAGIDSPLSRARGLGMCGAVSEGELDALDAFYRSRALATRFELCPYVDASLIAAIGPRGYRLTGFVSVFVRDLTQPLPVDGAVHVRRVAKGEGLAWSRLVGQGFGHEEPSAATIDLGLAQLDRDAVACFVAELDGTPVAGGVAAIDAEIAFLFGGSTLPAHRGRGAQTALIRARLDHARAAGCKLACVASSAGSASQRNIERAGFRVVYTRASFERDR